MTTRFNLPSLKLIVLGKDSLIEKVSLLPLEEGKPFSLSLSEDFSSLLKSEIQKWLFNYAKGEKSYLPDTYFNLFSLPPFTQRVILSLKKIQRGSTAHYQELAHIAGSPRAYRAVGSACKRNPFPLFYPCHRVIEKNGSLGGFTPGLSLKKDLLVFEKAYSSSGKL